MGYRWASQGFALPTIIITSVIMFAILVAAVSVVSSSKVSLDTQYYEGLAGDAAESGATHANSCLIDNNYVAVWTTNYLHPNTNCSGNASAACASPAACFMVNTTQYRSTYTVYPASNPGSGVQIVKVVGLVELLRPNGTVWDSFTKTTNVRVGAQISASQVTFGYISYTGAFFAVIGRDGVMRTVGYNGYGQLGNGTQTNTLTPTKFQAPTIYPIVSAYSNFLSIGFEMFAIDSQGNVYGAGANDLGQLGNGTFTHPIKTPTQVILPASVKAVYVSSGWGTSYVIGDDNNIYAMGACQSGMLGSNYTISGCSNKNSYVRVNLPTPNASDANTLPVAGSSGVPADNIVSDRLNTFVRMQGGRVYGWGINDVGALATGDNTSSSNPVKIGTFGDAGQSKAVQLAFDGEELYILDDAGTAYTTGNNVDGSLAGAPTQLRHQGTGKCLNNAYNSTSPSQAKIYDCINAVSQQMTFNPISPGNSYGTITTSPNSSTTLCLDNSGSQTADNNPVQWWGCNGSTAQQWLFRDDGSILNQSSGKCLNDAGNNSANDAPLGIWTCNNAFPDQLWSLTQSTQVAKVPTPASAGTVKQIATDQWSVLFRMSNGEVWGAGLNDRGQLCNGAVGKNINNALTRVVLPAGRQATYIYTTKSGIVGSDFANTYIILDDGSVYGCGANTYGQLGNGTTSASVGTPVKMNLPAGVAPSIVQTGYGTTVVLTTAGTVYTVGNNGNGQLGDGTTTNSSTPILARYINSQAVTNY